MPPKNTPPSDFDSGENSPMQWVVCFGNIEDGFYFVGPFDDRAKAVKYSHSLLDGFSDRGKVILLQAPSE